MNIVNTIITL